MGYTRFTNLEATGDLKAATLKGTFQGLLDSTTLSKSADYSLAAAEKKPYIGITLSAASKTVTLGLETGQVAIVVNEGGTNAFTLKNVAGDSGTTIATGKAYLVRASTTANATKLTLLNDGT